MKKQWMALCLSALVVVGAKSAAAKEKEQWSLLGGNAAGAYYADTTSFRRVDNSEEKIEVRTRAVLKDPGVIRLLNHHYGEKLGKADFARECLLTVVVDMADHTYKVEKVQLLSKQGKTLDKKEIKEDFIPIPEDTFIGILEKEVQAWDVLGKGTVQHAAKRI